MGASDAILEILREQDTYAAISFLSRAEDPLEVMKAFAEVSGELYWQHQNLPAFLSIAGAGVVYGLDPSRSSDPARSELSDKLRSSAKALCFNIASFTWPGWDEPGIEIAPSQLAIGLDAAKANLRLANELKKGDLPLSRAHWILAGHRLAIGDYRGAAGGYELARSFAAAAGNSVEALLASGFAKLAGLLDPSIVESAGAALEAIKTSLRAEQDGPEFVKQIATAQTVFSRTNRRDH